MCFVCVVCRVCFDFGFVTWCRNNFSGLGGLVDRLCSILWFVAGRLVVCNPVNEGYLLICSDRGFAALLYVA